MHRSKIDHSLSGLGHKQTKRPAWSLSALPPKADKQESLRYVKSGHSHCSRQFFIRSPCQHPPFAERMLRSIWPDRASHSGLMFAARITFPHFSVSSATSVLKSSGEPPRIMPPKSAS